MTQVKCKICQRDFEAKQSRLQKGWAKYCSKYCQYESQKVGKILECTTCSKEIYRNNKDQSRSKSKKYFCSKTCQTSWRNSVLYSGSDHSNWAGGESSYRSRLLRSKRQKICEKCLNIDVRVLAVHHKDKNRKNNTLSNLIWLCHNCHYLVHHDKKEAIGFLVPVA